MFINGMESNPKVFVFLGNCIPWRQPGGTKTYFGDPTEANNTVSNKYWARHTSKWIFALLSGNTY